MAKTGVLLANLGTPDNTDYWSMRRYLNEFLSDQRVIDYPRWKWQPLLQLIILSKRPFSSGAAYKSIWNEEKGESPLMTITRDQTEKMARQCRTALWRSGDGRFLHALRQSLDQIQGAQMVDAGLHPHPVLSAYIRIMPGATSATANDQFFRALMEETWQPTARVVEPYFENPALYRRARGLGRRGLCQDLRTGPISWSCPITACRYAT